MFSGVGDGWAEVKGGGEHGGWFGEWRLLISLLSVKVVRDEWKLGGRAFSVGGVVALVLQRHSVT